jgi:hypothetical protein
MAKKSRKQKRSRGRRRIGAALNPASPLIKLAAVAGGYFLAESINPMIDKLTAGKISDKLVAGGQTGLGALLLMGKGKSSIIKTVAGGIAAGSGLKRGLKAFGVIKPPVVTAPAVTGYGSVPVIGGYGSVPVIGKVGGYNAPGSLGAYALRSGRVGATQGSDLIGNN